MVYSQMASEGSANVVFPDGLKGEFTLYMFYGDIAYYGGINLYQKNKNDKVKFLTGIKLSWLEPTTDGENEIGVSPR